MPCMHRVTYSSLPPGLFHPWRRLTQSEPQQQTDEDFSITVHGVRSHWSGALDEIRPSIKSPFFTIPFEILPFYSTCAIHKTYRFGRDRSSWGMPALIQNPLVFNVHLNHKPIKYRIFLRSLTESHSLISHWREFLHHILDQLVILLLVSNWTKRVITMRKLTYFLRNGIFSFRR